MSKLPSIVSRLPNDLRIFLERVREALGTGQLVSREELIEAGIVAPSAGGGLNPITPDPITPPAPTGLATFAGLSTIIVAWDAPNYKGHAYAEIWRSQTDDLGTAQPVGQATGALFADPVGGNIQAYYWVRFVSVTDTPGAFNATAGVSGTVGYDPAYLIDVLSADNPQALLYKIPADTTINDVPVPAGIYIRDLYVANGSISNAKIGDAAIDDAKIASLSAAKVTFGEMSGDRIEADTMNADRLIASTLAARLALIDTAYVNSANIVDASINNAKLTGAIYSANWVPGVSGWMLDVDGNFYANSGKFRGALDGATGTFSGSLNAATGTFSGALDGASGTFSGQVAGGYLTAGDFTGLGWPAVGGTGAYLGPGGLMLGNLNSARYFQVTDNGDMYAPGFSIVNGAMTIDAINVIDTLQIAGNAVSSTLLFSGSGSFSFYSSTSAKVAVIAAINPRPLYTTNRPPIVYSSVSVSGGGSVSLSAYPTVIGNTGGDASADQYGQIGAVGIGVMTVGAGSHTVSFGSGYAVTGVLFLLKR